MHIHLDLIGGIAGDMFLASLLDCFPEYRSDLQQLLITAGFAELVSLSVDQVNDGIIAGTQVEIRPEQDAEGHQHRKFIDIRTTIENSAIDTRTRDTALDIFTFLAEAEGRIHGIDPEQVAFHELGAWDSIADILCSAYLITQLNPSGWSMSALPLGRGQVDSAHGRLPLPAPATTLLLEGFECFDDGLAGERITPTGAAILRYLSPAQNQSGSKGTLSRSGYGLGKKQFPGISNLLRCLVFEDSTAETGWARDQVLQLEFEVDDQTPEDLALALDQIRETQSVLDVTQSVAYGKKGRQVFCVRILARPEIENELLETCFRQTSTLGIRHQRVDRSILHRQMMQLSEQEQEYRVKVAHRPNRITAKVEMDDLTGHAGIKENFAAREDLRRKMEQTAVESLRKKVQKHD